VGEYTKISAARQDADSPIDEDLIGDLSDHGDYNYDHATRAGTDAAGVRLAFARGTHSFTIGNETLSSEAILFNTATDGDPNFASAPSVSITIREDSGSATAWTNIDSMAQLVEDTVTASDFDVSVRLNDGSAPATNAYDGYIDWFAYGAVTSGE
jgi:hypothetical protein